jgi:hypothetical protein
MAVTGITIDKSLPRLLLDLLNLIIKNVQINDWKAIPAYVFIHTHESLSRQRQILSAAIKTGAVRDRSEIIPRDA